MKLPQEIQDIDITKSDGRRHVRIGPGEYHVTKENLIITTILGSCVSACLYDPIQRIIGMNHFLLCNERYAKSMPMAITEAGRYGVYAMELVINSMMKLGAKRNNLRAKAFGGASILEVSREKKVFTCVGEVNCRFIMEFLENEKIPLVKSDLGGEQGRVIYFSFGDYLVYTRKVRKLNQRTIVKKEKEFWHKTLDARKKEEAEPDVDLWLK